MYLQVAKDTRNKRKKMQTSELKPADSNTDDEDEDDDEVISTNFNCIFF